MATPLGTELFHEFACLDIKVLHPVVVTVCDKDVLLALVKGYGHRVEQSAILCPFLAEVEDLTSIGSEYMYAVLQTVRNDNLSSV